MQVDLIGPLPPPHGGISTHVARLRARLEAAGHRVRVHAPQRAGEPWPRALLRQTTACRGDVVHVHLNGLADCLWLAGASRLPGVLGRAMVLTLHGERIRARVERMGWPRRRLVGRLFRGLGALVVVNPSLARWAEDVLGLDPRRVFVVPAFLAPDVAAARAAPMDPGVATFAARHRPLLVVAAFHLDDHAGVPLYGLDMLPGLLAGLRREHPRAGVVVHLATCDGPNDPRLVALGRAAARAGVADHLHVVTGSRPLLPTLARASVLLRPTVTDGDAVSIREACALGVPVVASDAVARPDGVVVFRSRDPAAFLDAVREALRRPAPPPSVQDGFARILEAYRIALGM